MYSYTTIAIFFLDLIDFKLQILYNKIRCLNCLGQLDNSFYSVETPSHHYHRAPVMELADMRDLGSRAAMRVGSSPFRRTTKVRSR